MKIVSIIISLVLANISFAQSSQTTVTKGEILVKADFYCIGNEYKVLEQRESKEVELVFSSSNLSIDQISLESKEFKLAIEDQSLYLKATNSSSAPLYIGKALAETNDCFASYYTSSRPGTSEFSLNPKINAVASVSAISKCHKKGWLDRETSGTAYDRKYKVQVRFKLKDKNFTIIKIEKRSFANHQSCLNNQ